ncbi:conserved protein of unknown function [Nitrospira japonica]|uniref:Zinc ribbon domain-containing protein n=1 Tax=Nitrospira japonica TaxID=1325564 RepID=A0A1W1I2H2_9BACT|nr:hypothetical protein [Nitrospira japonica]SLM47069.1 conserved protein of unknown function [Nitrospira japonica]
MKSSTASSVRCSVCAAVQKAFSPVCRTCGKVLAASRLSTASPRGGQRTSQGRPGEDLVARAYKWLLETDQDEGRLAFIWRTVVWLVLLRWSWLFMAAPWGSNAAGESFLHLVNLPFHEAGHLLFMPFGRFMMFLGGTLGQVLMPVICLGTFLMKTHDPFGAAVALWWTGENLLDIAPYIDDARSLDLVLLGGVTGRDTDGHDWENILGMLGWLEYDHRLAHLVNNAGILMMLAALLWSGALLLRHFRRCRMSRNEPAPPG